MVGAATALGLMMMPTMGGAQEAVDLLLHNGKIVTVDDDFWTRTRLRSGLSQIVTIS